MAGMERTSLPLALPALTLLPGLHGALFIVCLGSSLTLLAARRGRWFEGLRAAVHLLGFCEVHREEPLPEEILPWAGNV
jgi:hypothetical protein